MTSSEQYRALSQDEAAGYEKHICAHTLDLDRASKRHNRKTYLLSTALLLSLSLNLMLLFHQSHVPNSTGEPLSEYARLARDVPTVIAYNTSFNHPDRAVEDAAWAAPELQPQRGFVALDDSYTEKMGLSHSMRSPWFDDKGIYILASAHELHCLHVIRDVINQAHDGVPISSPRLHTMHCVNLLRESVMCNADDRPLYKGRLHSQAHTKHPHAGVGDVKMCRSWSKLQEWARERSACWEPVALGDPTFKEIDRYKFCPDGSKPWERLEGQK